MNSDGLLGKLFPKKTPTKIEALIQQIKASEKTLNDYTITMIGNITALNDITAKEIMVPRVDVVSLNVNSDIDDIISLVDEKGRTRLPVYADNLDNIIGILHTKDLIKYFNKANKFDLSKNLRTAYFIPESKFIGDLLIEFREKRIHMAVVVDEYGGMSGIVCMEDIIEKIVGQIQDEFDNETDEIVELDKNIFLVDAHITIEELNERLNINIKNDDVDTLGGLIYALFGRIPIKNDAIISDNIRYTITNISGRKLKRVKLEILDYDNAASGD